MRWNWKKNCCKILAYCLTLLFIYPTSPFVFKKFMFIKERNFISPLRFSKEVLIRFDIMGDGRFNAPRSGGRRHRGLDLVANIGEPVFAAKSGIVQTGEVWRGMGKYVKITHLNGYCTIYGHLNAVDVVDNSWVWQGQEIGEVGKSGNANYPNIEPHLHFEIRKDGVAEDPLPLIISNNK